jgi:hypothetical protein
MAWRGFGLLRRDALGDHGSGLLNPFGRLSKCKKLKQILLPANSLHRF